MRDDPWDLIRVVKLYCRGRTPDVEEQHKVERQLLDGGIPFPFQEMVSTIRTYQASASGQVDRYAIDHPEKRGVVAKLRAVLSDSQVLRVLEVTGDKP